MASRKNLKPGQLLKHKQDGSIATYLGPPQSHGPWASSEAFGLVRFAVPMVQFGDTFHVNLDDYKAIDFIDAIAGLA